MLYIYTLARISIMKDLITTASGCTVLNLGIASERHSGGESVTDFFNAVAFGSTAKFIAENFHTGQLIMINGHLINDHYTDKNGNKQYAERIVVDSVQFAGWNKKDLEVSHEKN